MEKKLKPPKTLEWIFSRFLRPEETYEKLGDFEECFREISREKGRMFASAWYGFQIFKAVPSFVSQFFFGSISMFKNYLIAAVRNLNRNKTYSFLNVLGLSVGMAAFIMIGLYVYFELTFDRYHKNADRIYQVVSGEQAVTPAPLAQALMREFPEVERTTHLISPRQFLVRCGEKTFSGKNWAWADEDLFSVFSFPLISGDEKTALKDPYSVVISEAAAQKYFGEKDPLGKTLQWIGWSYTADFMVKGIMKNVPENSYVKADIFASFSSWEKFPNYNPQNFGWGNYWTHTFLLLKKGQDPHVLEGKYPSFLTAQTGVEHDWKFNNRRLTDMHLHSTDLIFHFGPVSDIKYVTIFAAVAVIILLIAGFNYINLTTAFSVRRFREIGVRKVVGAQRFQLIRQFIGESMLLAILALAVAVILTALLMPVFNSLIQSETSLGLLQNPVLFAVLLLIVLLVGVLSSVYPAVFLSGFKPISVLKGTSSARSKKGFLRNLLVIAQFAISIFLIICTLTTARQLHYIRNKDLGFTKDHIVLTQIRGDTMSQKYEVLKQELLQYPGVKNVSLSTTVPMKIDWHNSFFFRNEKDPENNHVMSHYARVDYDYIDLFELEIVKGRKFSKELDDGRAAFIINEVVARKIGWQDPVGKLFHNQGQTGTIVGMVKDFHNENMHLPKSEVVLILAPGQGNTLSVKVDARNVPQSLASIERVWSKYSEGYPFEYEFMDQHYDNMYKSEIRLGKTFNYFSALAIFLCCLGLFGLASFTVEQGTKEIAVRKVLGASAGELITMLSWKFLKWVFIANLVAWPLAYIFMNSWLRSFSYRISIGWLMFVTAGLTAGVLAFLTVVAQTSKAALANPAHSLRYE
ncbi:MAG: ABC transporter permease [Candidatus Aminicenantes bacterium]|nr:ABC transporter permease [Candidatus Aminicenantes bacterium]